MKKITLILLSFILILSTAGCTVTDVSYAPPDTEVSPSPEVTASWPENVIMTVNGIEVDYREVLLYLLSAKEEAELLYGDGIWNYTLDEEGNTFGALRKEQVLTEVTDLRIACAHAEELGVDVYEEENRDAAEYTAEFIEKVGKEALVEHQLTEALIRQVYINNIIALKVYESITLGVDTDISDEEARQVKIQVIYKRNFTEGEDGTKKPLSDEEMFALRTKMQELRDTGMTKENFGSFAELNTDATDGVQHFVGTGDLPQEAEQIVFRLQEGEFSPVIEASDGFYLYKCLTALDEDATAAKKEAMIEERQKETFERTFSSWKEKADIQINMEMWNSLMP